MTQRTAAALALSLTTPAPAGAETHEVKTGLDVLEAKDFAALKGKKVGLLVNQTARTRKGDSLVDLLKGRKDLTLVTIFTPEHGLEGKKDEAVKSGTHEGIPVVSLYGERRKPTVD